jgi:4-azaleucine resistance transporter AzlC
MDTTIRERDAVPPTKMHAWMRGITNATPIVLGYVPIGFAYGVLAENAGLSSLNALLMSVIVFAGSSQLIAVALFAAGASPISIIFTTFVVNLRHLLFSTALSPYLKGWRNWQIAAFAYELTDETFALHSTSFANGQPQKEELFATNMTAQSSWVLGTFLGLVAGQLIADVKPLGLDYVLLAMFIGLLVLQSKRRIMLLTAAIGGLISTGLLLAGMSTWHVMVATIIGATIGMGVEQWTKRQSS